MVTERLCELLVPLQTIFENDECIDRLTFDLVIDTDHGSFRNARITHQGRFHLSRPDTVTGNFQHVIEASHDPEIAVFIFPSAITAQVHIFEFPVVRFLIPLRISPHIAEHSGPGFADDDIPAFIGSSFRTVFAEDRCINPKEGECCGTGFERCCCRERGDEEAAGFGLPPGIHDRAAPSTDVRVIPHPGFGIDRFPDGTKNYEATHVAFLRQFIALLRNRADGGRSRVELRHFVLLDDLPVAIPCGVARHAFEHHRCCSITQRTVDDVTVSGNPADVRSTPVDIILLQIKHPLVGDGRIEQIPCSRVENTFRFPCGS